MAKIPVAILGATGMVGQRAITLLENHPRFRVACVAASKDSAGVSYGESVKGRWHMDIDIPNEARALPVRDATNDIESIVNSAVLVFSAMEIKDKKLGSELEFEYAKRGMRVVSMGSYHRDNPWVGVIVPEINGHHLDQIPLQREHYDFNKGCLVSKPNCSLQSYLAQVYAVIKAGYPVTEVDVTTAQALSGAGFPGVSAIKIVGNRIPEIGGEELKTECEPYKILGQIRDGQFIDDESFPIYAQCSRDGVIDGHTAYVKLKFGEKKPTLEEVKEIWKNFSGLPQEHQLYSAPSPAISYLPQLDRPQPRLDKDTGKGMTFSTGRLFPLIDRKNNYVGIRFVGFSHNTIRGAAGGAILTAELMDVKHYLPQ